MGITASLPIEIRAGEPKTVVCLQSGLHLNTVFVLREVSESEGLSPKNARPFRYVRGYLLSIREETGFGRFGFACVTRTIRKPV